MIKFPTFTLVNGDVEVLTPVIAAADWMRPNQPAARSDYRWTTTRVPGWTIS